MEVYPAVIVHGLGDAVAALSRAEAGECAVTLLSAPGAALYAGCGWWRALVEAARARHPNVPCMDILDCADATGHALAALRIGVARLVLRPEAPGRAAVVAIAESLGGFVLPEPPPVNAPVNAARVNRGATRPNPATAQKSRTRENGDKRRAPG